MPSSPVPRRSTLGVVATVVAAAVLVVLTMVGVPADLPQAVVVVARIVLVTVVAAFLWLWRRDRSRYEQALRQEAAARAVAEDRLRIARQLHDTVSAGLGAITVRSAVALRLDDEPAALRAALADVGDAARLTTADLRDMLTVLRGQESQGPAGGDRRPQDPVPTAQPAAASDGARDPGARTPDEPGARRTETAPAVGSDPTDITVPLAAPLERARLAGLRVSTALQVPVPPALHDLVVRIVREALTNVTRYAGSTGVQVAIVPLPTGVRVALADDGPAPGWSPAPGTGTGLAQLAHDVEAAGGTLRAGPRAGRPGFVVVADLPGAAGPGSVVPPEGA